MSKQTNKDVRKALIIVRAEVFKEAWRYIAEEFSKIDKSQLNKKSYMASGSPELKKYRLINIDGLAFKTFTAFDIFLLNLDKFNDLDNGLGLLLGHFDPDGFFWSDFLRVNDYAEIMTKKRPEDKDFFQKMTDRFEHKKIGGY
jgi:hypothetical protein